nr:hypothetical protein [uncultured Moellerella sp.]
MISFHFDLFGYFPIIANDGAIIVMLATFGVLASLFILGIFVRIPSLKNIVTMIFLALLSSIFISLVVLLSLMNAINEDPIRLFGVWMVILFSCLSFFIFNKKYFIEILEDITNADKQKKQINDEQK